MAQWILWHKPEINLYLIYHRDRFRRFIKLLGFHEVMQIKGQVHEIDNHDIRVSTAKEYFNREDILQKMVRFDDEIDRTFMELFKEERREKRKFYQSRKKHDKIIFSDSGMHFLKEDELKFIACPRCKKRYKTPIQRVHFNLDDETNIRTFGKTCCSVAVYMVNVGYDTDEDNKFLISYQGYPGTKKAINEMIKSGKADLDLMKKIFEEYTSECIDSEPLRFYNYIRWS